MARARSWVWRLVSGCVGSELMGFGFFEGKGLREDGTSKSGGGGGRKEGDEGGERRAATEGGAEHG